MNWTVKFVPWIYVKLWCSFQRQNELLLPVAIESIIRSFFGAILQTSGIYEWQFNPNRQIFLQISTEVWRTKYVGSFQKSSLI